MAWFRREKKEHKDIPPVDQGLVCKNCRTPIPGNINLCPKCGLNPSVDTILDIYKPGQVKKLSRRRKKEG